MSTPNDPLTPPEPGQASGEPTGSTESLLAEITRLRQDLAKSRDLNREAQPLVQLAQTLWNAPGGKEIVERLRKGQPLTAAQAQQVQDTATGGGPVPSYMTPEAIQEVIRKELQQYAQSEWETRKAEKEMAQLDKRASEELEGYDNLKDQPEWNEQLGIVINMIEQRALIPPDDEPDPIYWAIKKTHQTLTGLKPGEKKVRPAKKTEAERRAAIAGQAGRQGGSPEDSSDEPDHPDLAWAKSRGSATIGKSFSSS